MPNPWTVEKLADQICEILRDDLIEVGLDFTPASGLVESGLDSLGLTQLLLAVQETTGVWVDESLLTPEVLANSLSLAACVHELLESS